MIKTFILSIIATLNTAFCSAQYNGLTIFHITSSHTSFPDAARDSGHTYNKVLYDAATHYSDSSVMIVISNSFKSSKNIDLVFWFHGWGNNIDSAAVRYKILQQFARSNLNAVLVFAETAKNASDSYGGKLEKPGTFKALVDDVLEKLKKEKKIGQNSKAENIMLAGHSGAYRVMAYILKNGNMPVQEVILFDALYGETDKFTEWMKQDQHRFIDIYTNGGGTNVETRKLANTLLTSGVSADTLEEKDLNSGVVKDNRIIFIHSLHQHNDVISDPENFLLFIENSPFLQKR